MKKALNIINQQYNGEYLYNDLVPKPATSTMKKVLDLFETNPEFLDLTLALEKRDKKQLVNSSSLIEFDPEVTRLLLSLFNHTKNRIEF
jgi:hypothetical protein